MWKPPSRWQAIVPCRGLDNIVIADHSAVMSTSETPAPPRERSRLVRWVVTIAKALFVAVWGFGWLVGIVLVGVGLVAQHSGFSEIATACFAIAIGVVAVWLISMGALPF
jgi:hypothetical protein